MIIRTFSLQPHTTIHLAQSCDSVNVNQLHAAVEKKLGFHSVALTIMNRLFIRPFRYCKVYKLILTVPFQRWYDILKRTKNSCAWSLFISLSQIFSHLTNATDPFSAQTKCGNEIGSKYFVYLINRIHRIDINFIGIVLKIRKCVRRRQDVTSSQIKLAKRSDKLVHHQKLIE